MSIRRVLVTAMRKRAVKVIGDIFGLAGEDFVAEVYQPWGFSSNPRAGQGGRSPLFEIQDDPDNYVAMPPSGNTLAEEGTAEIRAGDASIVVKDDDTIIVTGRLIINGIEFGTHIHPTPSGPSGPPIAPPE